jgi:hypothetical protein
MIRFNLHHPRGTREIDVAIGELVVAGWTGRDTAAVEKHIEELAAIGVARPKTTPCYYRATADRLTTATSVQVIGESTSGEVEFVLVATAEGLCVGVGSDHTDRKVEAYNVTVSKQITPKVIGPDLWRFDEVAAHWDRLVLRSHSTKNGRRRLYQEGAVAAMKSPQDLMRGYLGGPGTLPPGAAMYCGTLVVHGELEYGDAFEVELEDPVLGRSLRHAYTVRTLENIG